MVGPPAGILLSINLASKNNPACRAVTPAEQFQRGIYEHERE
jgi:hypothetical protein